MKYAFTDTLIMTNTEFYIVLGVCFVLGFPVGMLIGNLTGKLIRRFKK